MSSKRDRGATEEAFVRAVGSLLMRSGFASLGVNAIAKEAGANKSLIYRYFGGADGLYAAFANSRDIWPPSEELLGDLPARMSELPWRDALAEFILNYARALRRRPLTVELLALELTERNALVVAFEEARERQTFEVVAALEAAGLRYSGDTLAAMALIVSGVHYLLVRARTIRIFSGFEIREDSWWEEASPLVARALVGGL